MEPDPLLDSLRNAVAAMPDDVPLRLHLAALLLRGEQRDEAVRHLGAVLQRDPGNVEALAMLTTGAPAASGPTGTTAGSPSAQAADLPPSAPADLDLSPERSRGTPAEPNSPAGVAGAAGDSDDDPAGPTPPTGDPAAEGYDWSQAEDELRDVLPTMFVGEAAGSVSVAPPTLPRAIVVRSLTILVVLLFSKTFYLASINSYYTFYLIQTFQVSQGSAVANLMLMFVSAAAIIYVRSIRHEQPA